MAPVALLLPTLLAAALLALGTRPHADDPRVRLGEALRRDSGEGDLSASIEILESLLEEPDLPPEVRAEALYRLGDARLRTNADVRQARAAWERLTADPVDHHPWSEQAAGRLAALQRRRSLAQVETLPFDFDFGADLGSWYQHSQSEAFGTLKHLVAEDTPVAGQPAREGVACWQTWVDARRQPVLVTELDATQVVVRSVGVEVRAIGFPAFLLVVAVDDQNRRFVSAPRRLDPEAGWQVLEFSIGELESADDPDGVLDAAGLTYLLVQDATAAYSTDSGANVLLFDRIGVR